MSQLYRTILSYCSVLLCLCLSLDSYAEGSKDLYPGGATGQRAYLMSTTNTSSLSWPYPTLGTHYAYVKPGETIAAASSAQGVGSGQIRLTAPNGTVYTTTVGTTTAGRIQNRTQELAGPFAGYTPYVRVAGSAEEGIWKIEFLPTISSSALAYDKATPNIDADDPWTQSDKDNTIAAWDVSVSSAGTAATIISGRVYATVMDMYVTSSGTYFGKLYVQTNDGYTYKVNNNGQAGAGFVFFVNNKGITNGNGDAAQPSYKSLNTSNAANVPIWDPRTADGAQSITHKMFYARPDAGLPTSASLPGGTSTWLKMPKIIPTVSSISIDGVEGTSGQVSSKGAYIKFNASQAGTFRITLSGSGGFATRIIRGSAVAGSNSVFWNGKDNDGNAPSTGTANITADIQLQGAEVHFPFFDVESNINGIIIEQLNDDGTVKSDIVYWDDSDASLNGTSAPSPRNNGNDGAGLHSNSNGHKWGTNYGNEKTMDTWAYVLGEVASQNTVLNIRRADLEVQPFNPAPVVTQVAAGQPITYKVAVVNNGPSDVEGAPFKFKVPAGFTIANLSDITVTTSCGIVNNALIDASGNYTALVDLPNGCIITFSITGRPGASLAGGPLSMEASIMRPNDVTDPDATNPDPAVPPTDPHVECENGTGTESCNNIKYNAAVTVTASADIVTVKSTGATNYVPGKSVDYTITVTNNGPSDAANVRVVDNAPGGGPSISSWTAVVTSGVVSLPATSGSGDLDQTIALLPNGAVVTYTLRVDIPADYNSSLVNTATVTSTTPDPVPACPACTTAPLSPAAEADIVTVKSTSATNYVPGESVTYSITVTNDGPSDAGNVRVVDNAPAGTTIGSWSAAVTTGTVTLSATSGSGNLDQTIAALPNGAVVTYTVTVDIPSSYNSNLVNTVTVTSPTPDPMPACPGCTTTPLSPSPSADIVTVKSTSATDYVPGASVTYTIALTNNGPSDAANVNVVDNAPAGTTISSWSAAVTTGTVTLPNTSGTGNINETIAAFPDGAVVTYTVTVDVPSNYSSSLTNTATVTSLTPDPVPGCTNCTTPPISAAPSADIVTTKTTSATSYVPGQSVTYTITVTNNGPSDAANVNVVDNAPAGTAISSWSASVATGTVTLPNTSGTGNINETIAAFPDGAVVTYTVTVDVPSNYNSSLSNTATVTSPTPDPAPGCTTCTTPPINAAPSADIVTTKTTSATSYVPGQSVTYTITVTNNGPSDAANVNVVDNAPAGTAISSWSASVTTGTVTLPSTSGTGNINETIAAFPDGAVVTYTVTVDVPSNYNSSLSNTATVTSPTPDPAPGCTTCTTPPINAAPSADIVTTKTTSATSYVPGQSVTYTITVTNSGPSDAANVNVVDNAPAGTAISSWSASVTTGTVTLPNTSGSGNINETIAALPNGAVVTYTITVAIPSNYNSNLTNTATVTSPTPDPVSGCTTCTTPPITAAPSADIVTTKTTGSTSYVSGGNVLYTITVTNNGPSDAANVNVVDNAPMGTTISSWTAAVTNGTVTLPNTSGTGNLNQTITTLPNGAVVTYTVTVAIPSGFTGNLSNTATVTSPTPDPTPGCTACTTPPISAAPSADIVTTKTTSSTGYVPGGTVTYTITVRNNGPSNASNVNVVDNAPTGTTISSWTAAVTTGTVTLPNTSGTGNLNQTITTLPNGAVVTYTVTVAIPSGFTGNLSNTAAVTSPTPDPVPACTNCTTPPISAAPSADIVTTKTTSATGYVPGGSVIYTITVRNSGPSNASNVNVVDNAPTGTTISSWTAAVTTGTVTLPNTSGTGNLNQTITTLPNGAVVTYTVTVAIPSGFTGNLSNTAAVTSPTPDPVPACTNCTTPPISAAPSADIVTTKTTSATGYVPGGSVIYTITVRNNGPSNASNVNVVDNAPTGTTISSWTAAVTNGTVTLPNTSGTGNLNQTITTLPNGAVVTYTVTVAIPSGFTGNLSNTATVTSPTPDPTPGCTACTTPPISAAPSADIVTTKTTSATGYVPGGSVTYTITIRNNGPSNASNVNVVDNALAGTTISNWTAAVTNGTVTLPNTSGTGNLNQTITTLPNGAVVTYTVTVAIPSGFTGNLSNTAAVTSPTPDPTPGCAACTTTPISAAPSADIVTVKTTQTAGQTTFTPGENVIYTITVTNNGPSDAATVNIKDIAPTGTTIGAWTASVTKGSVTLPNTSGTGNLDETIATLPNGAVVTYTVTIQTPATFTGTLSNTATVTSATPDPVPACAACTTAPLTGVTVATAPVADNDVLEGKADNTLTIPVLNNDKPGTGANPSPIDPTTLEIVEQPKHGTVKISEDGTLTYTPDRGYYGQETFTYRVQDEAGNWSNVATVTLSIVPNELDIPNVITPNGDGANDRFVIKGLEKYTQHEIIIFNRWNNMLFRSKNYHGDWEGKGLNAGTYYYTLKVQESNGQWHTYNGYIMLMR